MLFFTSSSSSSSASALTGEVSSIANESSSTEIIKFRWFSAQISFPTDSLCFHFEKRLRKRGGYTGKLSSWLSVRFGWAGKERKGKFRMEGNRGREIERNSIVNLVWQRSVLFLLDLCKILLDININEIFIILLMGLFE